MKNLIIASFFVAAATTVSHAAAVVRTELCFEKALTLVSEPTTIESTTEENYTTPEEEGTTVPLPTGIITGEISGGSAYIMDTCDFDNTVDQALSLFMQDSTEAMDLRIIGGTAINGYRFTFPSGVTKLFISGVKLGAPVTFFGTTKAGSSIEISDCFGTVKFDNILPIFTLLNFEQSNLMGAAVRIYNNVITAHADEPAVLPANYTGEIRVVSLPIAPSFMRSSDFKFADNAIVVSGDSPGPVTGFYGDLLKAGFNTISVTNNQMSVLPSHTGPTTAIFNNVPKAMTIPHSLTVEGNTFDGFQTPMDLTLDCPSTVRFATNKVTALYDVNVVIGLPNTHTSVLNNEFSSINGYVCFNLVLTNGYAANTGVVIDYNKIASNNIEIAAPFNITTDETFIRHPLADFSISHNTITSDFADLETQFFLQLNWAEETPNLIDPRPAVAITSISNSFLGQTLDTPAKINLYKNVIDAHADFFNFVFDYTKTVSLGLTQTRQLTASKQLPVTMTREKTISQVPTTTTTTAVPTLPRHQFIQGASAAMMAVPTAIVGAIVAAMLL